MRNQDTARTESRANKTLAGRVLKRALVAGMLLFAAMPPGAVGAQANAAKAPLSSNRWLLVVDTSRAMHRRSGAVLKAVEELLMSDLNGQLRRGDTLGLWTFNKDLYAGRFPLQIWSPEAKKEVGLRALGFLEAQKYESGENFDKVLPSVAALVRDSDIITIILISSGEEDLHGTPFDARINEFYQQWRDQQRKAQMPFITVLRGKGGQLADFTVSTPPWPVQMPALPPAKRPTETIQPKPQAATHKAPSPTVAPLIFSGSNPNPETVTTPQPAPAGVKAEAPPPAAVAASASKAASPQLPQPSAPAARITTAEPPLKPPETPPAQAAPRPAPTPAAVAEPKAELLKAPEPALAKPDATPAPPASAANPALLAVEPSKAAAVPEAASGSAPAVAATQKAPVAAPADTTPTAPVSSPRHAVSAESAAAVPSESWMRRWSLWIGGLVLGMTAIGLTILLRRKSRPAPQGSLITRSFERDKKP